MDAEEYNRGLQDGVRMETVGEQAFLRAKIALLEQYHDKLIQTLLDIDDLTGASDTDGIALQQQLKKISRIVFTTFKMVKK